MNISTIGNFNKEIGTVSVERFSKSGFKDGSLRARKRLGTTSYKMHWHEFFEMLYYSGCSGVCRVNGTEYPITDNCIFLMTPMDFHEIKTEDTEGSFSVVTEFSESIINEKLFKGEGIKPRVLYSPSSFLSDCFNEINRLFCEGGELAVMKMTSLIGYILTEVCENGTPLGESSSYLHPEIRRAVSYMLANFGSDISLSSVAKMCGMTPAYFSNLFHRVMGKTFKVWLTELRIEHAKRMLEAGDESVISIAYECGYNTPSHFIKVFGETVGVTPKEYGNKVRGKSEK